jgi:transcriptional regulator with XRE-family HTH domain
MSPRSLKRDSSLPLLGKTVKALRADAGMTQRELAARSGIDTTYVSKIERGAANLTLVALGRHSAGLEMPSSALVSRVEDAELGR